MLDPDYEKMDHYRVDFDAEERVLYQLDFMESEYQRPNRLTYHLFFTIPLIKTYVIPHNSDHKKGIHF